MVAFYVVLMIGGGNDILAYNFHLSINTMIRALQVLLIVAPIVTFIVTKRIAVGLQRRDRDLLLHGRETGRILRMPTGEFLEIHEPVDEETRAVLLSKHDAAPLPTPEAADEQGVRNPKARAGRLRSRWSGFFYKDNIALPSQEELVDAEHHVQHELDKAVDTGSAAAAEIAGESSSVSPH